jgi:hypothetical protein
VNEPVLLVTTEGALVAINVEWGVDDVILDTAGPAELDARLRLAIGRLAHDVEAAAPDEIRSGDVSIDEATYFTCSSVISGKIGNDRIRDWWPWATGKSDGEQFLHGNHILRVLNNWPPQP